MMVGCSSVFQVEDEKETRTELIEALRKEVDGLNRFVERGKLHSSRCLQPKAPKSGQVQRIRDGRVGHTKKRRANSLKQQQQTLWQPWRLKLKHVNRRMMK
eukprot:GHVN01097415.1.p1 GENE.GHVN01097415.1~~GHVN01097415.1.p1  ORF type:complete len:101 (-),score=10.64 GHVN01097415.1:179-481(-)